MKIVCALFFFLVLFTGYRVVAQEKYAKVKIYLSKDHVRDLQQAGLEFDHVYYDDENQNFTTTLNAHDMAILAKTPLKYTVLVDDEVQDFLKRNKGSDFYQNDNTRAISGAGAKMSFFEAPSQNIANIINTPAAFTAGSMGGYYTLAEMNTKIDNMKASYPSMVKIDTIGTTYLGKKIRVIKLASNAAVNKPQPEILIDGLHHAREPLGMMNIIFFMQYLLENYSTNARIQEVLDSRQLYFIPCINPDGYQQNYLNNPGGGGLIRKNMKPNGDGTFGVDLNRNYGFDFGYNNTGSSNTTSADNYRGPAAFSERETQAMRDYVRTRQFKIMLEYHSYGGYWINSYCVPARTLKPSDSLFLAQSGAQMTKYSFYKVGTPLNTVGYEANGGSNDWWFAGDVANIDSIPSFSPEVGLGLATFWPAASTIIPYCKQVFYGSLQAVLVGGSFVKIEDKTPVSLPAGVKGNFTFNVRRLGRVDSSVKVTVLPLENIDSTGAPFIVNTLTKYNDTVNGSVGYKLSATAGPGSRVRFVYKTETGGITKLDTVVTFYMPIPVFSDDMETGIVGTKWTAATWAYSTKKGFGGTQSLANVPATGTAKYSANANVNVTTKTALDLSNSTAAYLSFWVYYKSENGNDKMQVLGASSATSGAYVALSGINSVAENAGTIAGTPSFTGQQGYWVRESISLATHLGQTDFNLRFNFTSNAGTATDSGFFIDDITIVKSSSLLLPAQFLSFNGKLLDNISVLEWAANTDDLFDHFDVERAADGKNFNKIGQVDAGAAFKFYDSYAAGGNAWYRIRQVDKNGKSVYSKTILLNIPFKQLISLAPSITASAVKLGLHLDKGQNIYVEIIDAMGRMVKQLNYNVTKGDNSITVNVSNLSAQQYFLKIRNDNNELLGVKPFIKY